MLQPNRRKYRKDQKGRNYGLATRGANVSFGEFGLKTLERGRITARQIEAARRAITRHIACGSVCSRTSPSPASLLKSEWVTVRVIRSTGLRWFSRAVCSMKWTGLTNSSPAKLLLSLPPSCP